MGEPSTSVKSVVFLFFPLFYATGINILLMSEHEKGERKKEKTRKTTDFTDVRRWQGGARKRHSDLILLMFQPIQGWS